MAKSKGKIEKTENGLVGSLAVVDLSSKEFGGSQPDLPPSWPTLHDTWSLCGEREVSETTEVVDAANKYTQSMQKAAFGNDVKERQALVVDFLTSEPHVMEIASSWFVTGQQQPCKMYRDNNGKLRTAVGNTRCGAVMVGCAIATLTDNDLATAIYNAALNQEKETTRQEKFLKSIGLDNANDVVTFTEGKGGKIEPQRNDKALKAIVAMLREIFGKEVRPTVQAIIEDVEPSLDASYQSNIFKGKHKLEWGYRMLRWASAKKRVNGKPNYTAIAQEAQRRGIKSLESPKAVYQWVRECVGVCVAVVHKSKDDCGQGEISVDEIAEFRTSGYTEPTWNKLRLKAGIKMISDANDESQDGPAFIKGLDAKHVQDALDEYHKEKGDKTKIVAVFAGAGRKGWEAADFAELASWILTTREEKRKEAEKLAAEKAAKKAEKDAAK